jgi:zinc finger CCHC domain-containing protein 9
VDHLAKDCKVTKDQAGTTVVGKIDLDQGADDDDYHIFVTEQRKHTKEVAEEKKIASPVVDRRPAQKKKVVKF